MLQQISHVCLIASLWFGHTLHPADIPIAYEIWHNLGHRRPAVVQRET